MDRVATLNDDEYKVLMLVRSVMQAQMVQTHLASNARSELEDLYHLLNEANAYSFEEFNAVINEAKERVYRMLY